MAWLDLLNDSPLAQRLAWTIIHFVWQGTLIAVVLAVVLAVLDRASANTRYLTACAALLAAACSPLVTFIVMPTSGLAGRSVAARVPAIFSNATAGSPSRDISENGDNQTLRRAREPAGLQKPAAWPTFVLLTWSVVVLGRSLWLLTGWLRAERLRSHGIEAANEALVAVCARLAERLGITRPVTLLLSHLADVPLVIGWLRPCLLLPAELVAGADPWTLEALIAHELAHIRRHDYLVNLLQNVIETLLIYHPAVWWICRNIRAARESCCDDMAISVGDRIKYARALSDLAFWSHRECFHFAMAADSTSLQFRLARIMGAAYVPSKRERRETHRYWLFGLGVAALYLLFWWFFISPQKEAIATRSTTGSLPLRAIDAGSIPKAVISPAPVPVKSLPRSPADHEKIIWDGADTIRFSDRFSGGERSKSYWIDATPGSEAIHVLLIPLNDLLRPHLIVHWKLPNGEFTSDGDAGSGRGGRPQMIITSRDVHEPIRLNIHANGPDNRDDPPREGNFAVCIRRLRDAKDLDPEIIGIESSLIVLDDARRAELPWRAIDELGHPIAGAPVAIDYPGDIDIFQLPTSSRSGLGVILEHNQRGSPLLLALYDADRQVIAAYGAVEPRVTVPVPTTAKIPCYLMVTGNMPVTYRMIITEQ